MHQYDRAAHRDEEPRPWREGCQVWAIGADAGCRGGQRLYGRRAVERRAVLRIVPMRLGLLVLPYPCEARRHLRRRGAVVARELHASVLVEEARGRHRAPVLLPGFSRRERLRGQQQEASDGVEARQDAHEGGQAWRSRRGLPEVAAGHHSAWLGGRLPGSEGLGRPSVADRQAEDECRDQHQGVQRAQLPDELGDLARHPAGAHEGRCRGYGTSAP
mmetsp:Transcript_35093/g.101044  ORF Transcript_35093/g.101044 Transcript_35093/m.101044 type:complete len:217 (-) Transcript_35093:366-1016(-)